MQNQLLIEGDRERRRSPQPEPVAQESEPVPPSNDFPVALILKQPRKEEK